MGRHEKQPELWAKSHELSRRIPADNLLRKIDRLVDLDFVRQEVSPLYGKNGNESVDPVQIMKMLLLLFIDDVASERELMSTIPLRIDYLWFLGYGLEDEIPHHSVLSKARARWGEEIFTRLFKKTVEICWKAGLVDGKKVHVDSSLVRADASLNSIVDLTVEKLEEKSLVNERCQSTTDPDSTLVGRRTGGKSLPSYQVHRALDDKKGVITAVKSTTGAVNEAHQLVELVGQHEQNVQVKAQVVVADSKYGTSANYIALGQQGITTHMADFRRHSQIKSAEGIYEAERFIYDPNKDLYRCPANQELQRHHYVIKRGYYEYRPGKGICSQCPLRQDCTRDKNGRTLKRYQGQEFLDRGRTQAHSPEAIKDRHRRLWLVEGKFGQAAVEHGMKRSRWRGMWKQSIQDHLIAAIQNLRVLLWPFLRGPIGYFRLRPIMESRMAVTSNIFWWSKTSRQIINITLRCLQKWGVRATARRQTTNCKGAFS